MAEKMGIRSGRVRSVATVVFMISMILFGGSATVNAKGHAQKKHHHHVKHSRTHHSFSHGTRPDQFAGVGSGDIQKKTTVNGALDELSESFYDTTCPGLTVKVFSLVKALVAKDDTLPAAWLRLHFHDCFVNGCDASVLISASVPNSELNATPNKNSLRGMDILATIKTAVEILCPAVVSCADLLALVARDSIFTLSGAYWQVPFGRRDGLVSSAAAATAALPSPFSDFNTLVQNFEAQGMDAEDMVVLSGGHTIGFTHCALIQSRLYNFSGSPDGVDPTLDGTYAKKLQKACPFGPASAGTIIPLDPTGGNQTFDSQFYSNVLQKRGVFTSDAALITTSLGLEYTEEESGSASVPDYPFFQDFGTAMEKMGRINVLTGTEGQVRLKCDAFNPIAS